jgi:PIN domain nuclease of toxin-antitoxin system
MNYILDTHTIIWFLNDDDKLSKTADNTITSKNNKNFVSIVSLWELAIKINLNKFKFDGGFSAFLELINKNGFEILPLKCKHIHGLFELPFIHKDPFDRILISTSIAEKMPLITADENIRRYNVTCIW